MNLVAQENKTSPLFSFINAQAIREGWAVFFIEGTQDDGDYRIERLDASNIFRDDPEVWSHVINTEFDRLENHAANMGLPKISQHFLRLGHILTVLKH